MGILNKILGKLKLKEDSAPYYKIETAKNNERRIHPRVPFPANFCIFVPENGEEPAPEKTPFVHAALHNINFTGAAFRCESVVACSPFDATLEREIRPHGIVVFILNQAVGEGCSGCRPTDLMSDGDKEILYFLSQEVVSAEVVWVKPDGFGCRFVNPGENLTRAVGKMTERWEKTKAEEKAEPLSL